MTRPAKASPPTFAPAQEVVHAMRRLVHVIDLRSKQILKQYGVTGTQLSVLAAAVELEDATVSRISQVAALTPGTVSGVLDRLEARGLVRRERSATDRRKVVIVAEPAVLELMSNRPNPLQAQFAERFESLSPGQQSRITAALKLLTSLMNEPPAEKQPAQPIAPSTTPAELRAGSPVRSRQSDVKSAAANVKPKESGPPKRQPRSS